MIRKEAKPTEKVESLRIHNTAVPLMIHSYQVIFVYNL